MTPITQREPPLRVPRGMGQHHLERGLYIPVERSLQSVARLWSDGHGQAGSVSI